MKKKTLLFLGSKPIGFYCFEFLIQQQNELNIEILGLLSNDNPTFNPDLSLKHLATQHGIAIMDALDNMPEVDFLVSVQYHEILKANHLAKAKILAINLHMAPLPDYRGCNQFSFAILDGKREFGTTLHVMDSGIDHGDILFEKRFPIPEACWVQDLYQLTFDASINLFKQHIKDILVGNYTRTPQAELIPERGYSLHYRHEMATIKQVDLSWNEEKIARHVRACSMPGFEPPYALVHGEKIYLSRTWQKG